MNDTLSENNDTVGQIVHYIMKNEGMYVQKESLYLAREVFL